MFLKKIKINGFKSFAKPITIKFDSPLTAIVGPNGSGKSNIVDAIRWVLGEQSARTLRGNKMADIIFSGSKNHKPLNKASVFLYLDNSDHTFNINTDEVIIGRRVNDEGESDYILNGKNCRLKDIKELLLDTGLGNDQYSIVGQGKIDSIINSKPAKLRELFEEAAGISKHKIRKEEAKNKLENTRQNLQRINDLIKELQRQLRPLKKQVEKADKYEKLKLKLAELEISLLLEKWEKNRAEFTSIETDKEYLEERFSAAENKLNELKINYNNNNQLLEKKKSELSEKKEDLFRTETKIEELNNKLTLYEERKNNISDDLKEINNWKKTIANKKDKIKDNLLELDQKISSSEIKINDIKNKINTKKNKLDNINTEITQKREELNILENNLLDGVTNITNIKHEIEKINDKKAFLNDKKTELLKEKDDLLEHLKNRERDKEKVKNELDSVIKNKKNLNDSNIRIIKEKDKKIPVYEQEVKKLEVLKDKYKNIKSRLNILSEMDENYDGYYYGVKNVLKNTDKYSGIKGVTANLINVNKKYIKAIETALAGKMQNIVVDCDSTASNIIKFLKRNRLGYATFLPLNLISGNKLTCDQKITGIRGYIGPASEVVNHDKYLDDVINYLLGNTIIASNIDAAAEISRKSNSRYRIVTLEGEIIRPGGAMTGGSKKSNSNNLISRSQEKANLKNTVDKLENEINNKNRKIAVLKQEITDYKKTVEKNKENIHLLDLDIGNINADLTGIKSEISEIKKRLNIISEKIIPVKQELDKLTCREKEYLRKIDKINNKSKDNNIIEKNKHIITEFEKTKKNITDKITELKITLATEEQKIENYFAEKKRFNDELSNYNLDYKQRCADLENKNNKLLEIKKKIKNVHAAKYNKKDKIEALRDDISLLENKVEYHKKINLKISSQQDNIREKTEKIKEQLYKIELKLNRLDSNCERCKEKLREEYEINPEKNNFAGRIKITDHKNASNKINEFKNTMKALEPINTGAQNEYKKIKERVDYLKEQKSDLQQARNSINKFIEEVEKTMGNLFYATYSQVKTEFENIFSELFSGGKACLHLDDKNNILTTGVEITAQPPGKKLKKLSLMSGGERALTAIALVFAFLNVNPGPFYILDEIDAPLDDANVIRFSKFINKYAKYTQFIIITHRKYMMTQAGIIYGVTMEDLGVSKLVSLNITNTGGKVHNYV